MSDTLDARIRDRLTIDWLTPSQKRVWEAFQRFDGPPHRVINIYGTEGTGKTFIGLLMERLSYSTYCVWPDIQKPLLSRLTIDDMVPDRSTTRNLRPLVDKYGIQQIILLSHIRVDEKAMPAFELRITEEDMESFRANLYRHLQIIVPEEDYRNFKVALKALA